MPSMDSKGLWPARPTCAAVMPWPRKERYTSLYTHMHHRDSMVQKPAPMKYITPTCGGRVEARPVSRRPRAGALAFWSNMPPARPGEGEASTPQLPGSTHPRVVPNAVDCRDVTGVRLLAQERGACRQGAGVGMSMPASTTAVMQWAAVVLQASCVRSTCTSPCCRAPLPAPFRCRQMQQAAAVCKRHASQATAPTCPMPAGTHPLRSRWRTPGLRRSRQRTGRSQRPSP